MLCLISRLQRKCVQYRYYQLMNNETVLFDFPIVGVQHALRDNATKGWSERKLLLEGRIAAGQRVKLRPEPENPVDPWAIQAFYDYDGRGNWQPVGRAGTDHVCRVRALIGQKKVLTAKLIRWDELNGHPDVPVGTIWVQVNAPRDLVEPSCEMETIGRFRSPLSELLLSRLPVRLEEKNLEALCDDILEERNENRLQELARRYLNQMDTAFASDDRYYHLAIVHHLQSFTNEQLQDVADAILHNRHNYDSKSKPLEIYRRQMEHVREAIRSAHGLAEQFCRIYDTDSRREELTDKLKEPLLHDFARAFPIDCMEEEKSFANRLFYGRYSRKDLYTIYCHVALLEYFDTPLPATPAAEPWASSAAPSVLLTPKALELWAKAREQRWVGDDLQLLCSQRKAAILASVMADALDLKPRWAPFEQLWGIRDLANKLSLAQLTNYYAEVLNAMVQALQ